MAGAAKPQVKDLAAFRAAHDKNFIIPSRLRAALDKLGRDGWEYELPFQKAAGVSTTDGARFREQFDKFIVTVDGKRIYCGSEALAKKMKGMI